MTDAASTSGPLNFHTELENLWAHAPNWWAELSAAVTGALDGGDINWLVATVGIFVAGVVGERLACWKLNALNRRITEQTSDSWTVVLGFAAFRILFDILGVVIFGIAAWLGLYLLVTRSVPLYQTLELLILAVVTFRVWVVLARAVFAPHSPGIRPLALGNEDAGVFYRWTAMFIGTYSALTFFGTAVVAGNMSAVLARTTRLTLGISLIAIMIAFVWRNRERIADLFDSEQSSSAGTPSVLRQTVAQSWHLVVTAWLMALWISWAYAMFTNDAARVQSTEISWWITLAFPIGDRLFHALLHKLSGVSFLHGTGFDERRERFISTVQTCVRAILATVAITALALTWNIAGMGLLGTPLAERAIWAAVNIGVTLLIAYVLYEVVIATLDKYMPKEPEMGADTDGEIGKGMTRTETLAPLLRGVFIVVLVVMVILTVLSSLGIQIFPLIAGASIVGLAVGFGSQKLVQDIISGVFFLIDDALRRGEYINVGEVKGTVEKISIRSLQLRHQNGPLHTIPFGEIRHLTNYSRDWALMKLKLRLTYETDVERVRKLIKKLGQELLEDEVVGPMFMQPLKSQGVYSMEDDSAMIVRVKFMTSPGDQFMVRKTVYTRIRELFEREGIEFAHRVVSVRIDTDADHAHTGDEKLRAAGAAALARDDKAPQT